MKIAIIGAGFAALGAAHYLQEMGEITFFDKGDPSASRMAAGLLHKFSGLKATKNLFGDEALKLAVELIKPITKTGLYRIADSESQWRFFKKTALIYPDEVKIASDNSIYIEEAYVVDCLAYLSSINYIKKEIESLEEISDFDLIILANGADILKLAPDLSVYPIYGQLIELKGETYPEKPMTGDVYVIPLLDKMVVGSTYERTPQNAEEILLPKLHKMLPDFKVTEILQVKGAYRASTPDHLPFVRQVNHKTWAIAGFGSKGLLYHAYYGRLLAEQIKNN